MAEGDGRGEWVGLGEACRRLGVKEATLRQWADAGKIRSIRTAGGHRRFALEDLAAFMEAGNSSSRGGEGWEERALRMIRRRLAQATSTPWYQGLDERGHAKLRFLGRRLLDLTQGCLLGRKKKADLVEEARFIGEEHGQEVAHSHLPLKEVISAYLFFRNTLWDSLKEFDRATGGKALAAWKEVDHLGDEFLLAAATAYEKNITQEGNS